MNSINKHRLQKELAMFSASPPTGISCSPKNDSLEQLTAQILGAPGTPFEGGVFDLEIQIPPRYPFDPPRVRFLTPIYHPNIDTSGRICLDTLKLPPKGSWKPCLNLSTVLMMIRVLMAEPGSEDPLMTEIWQEFKYEYSTYIEKAKHWTRLHAMDSAKTKNTSPTTGLTTAKDDSHTTTTAGPVKQSEKEQQKQDKEEQTDPRQFKDKMSSSGEKGVSRGSKLKVKSREGLQDVSNKKMKLDLP